MHRTVILSLEGTKLIHLLFVNCVQTEFEILTTRLSQLGGTLPLGSNNLTLRRLMSYIYGAPILDVSRSHTTTQHSR